MKTLSITLSVSCLLALPCSAATLASDSAADSVYSDGWDNGDNGGSGWGGGWILSGVGGFSGHFIGSSTANGDGDGNSDGDIDTSGRSWGQFAHTSNTSGAIRPFSGSLTTGQTVEVGFDNGFIQNGGAVGIALQNSSGENLVEFLFVGGSTSGYTVNAGSYTGTTPGFTDEGMTLAITQTAANAFGLSVNTLNPAASFGGTGTYYSPSGGQEVTQLRLFNFNSASSGGQPAFDSFANSIAIVPEPSIALLGSVGILALLRRRRI